MTQQANTATPLSTDAEGSILFHDGCEVCLDIARVLGQAIPGLSIVDLGLYPEFKSQAEERGVVNLPSLVVGGKVMPVDPHSEMSHIGFAEH